MSRLQVGQVVDLVTLSKLEAKIGTITETLLSYEDFIAENLGVWYPLDGRSCIGTTYHSITGNEYIPNAMTDGLFLRQAKENRAIGSIEGDAIRNITGGFIGTRNPEVAVKASGAFMHTTPGASRVARISDGSYSDAGYGFDASRVVPTADENRPKNLAVNFFIKVEY